MTSITGTSPERGRLTALPLAVAYGAIPLGVAAARFAGGSGPVSVTAPWLFLAGIGAILAMLTRPSGTPGRKGAIFKVTLFLLMAVGLFLYSPDIIMSVARSIPYLNELSPLVFMLFSGLWVATCGLPDRSDFQRFGALLGTLCIADLACEVVLYQAVPTVRWIGNADMLAGLLLVPLCAGLKPGGNDGGAHEPDQGLPWWRALVMLGIMSCLSRTGLFAAAWVVLCFGRGRVRYRVIFAVLCAALLAMTFLLPTTASDSIRYTDYWLWIEALRLFTEGPGLLLTGFPIAAPLPLQFPTGMAPIWETATGQASSMGAFLFQVPSFWLRLTMTWGIGAPLLILTTVFILIFRRLTRMGAGLTAALFAQGMTTPLLFDPATGIAISLGFILAMATPLHRPNTRVEEQSMPDAAAPMAGADPAREWDLRPL